MRRRVARSKLGSGSGSGVPAGAAPGAAGRDSTRRSTDAAAPAVLLVPAVRAGVPSEAPPGSLAPSSAPATGARVSPEAPPGSGASAPASPSSVAGVESDSTPGRSDSRGPSCTASAARPRTAATTPTATRARRPTGPEGGSPSPRPFPDPREEAVVLPPVPRVAEDVGQAQPRQFEAGARRVRSRVLVVQVSVLRLRRRLQVFQRGVPRLLQELVDVLALDGFEQLLHVGRYHRSYLLRREPCPVAACRRLPEPTVRRLTAPPGAQPTLQESSPFHGADSWPTVRRLTAPPGAQPTLRESSPFHGADSQPTVRRLTAPPGAQPTLRESSPFHGADSRPGP